MVELSNGDYSSIAQEAKKDGVGALYSVKPSMLEDLGHKLFTSENSTSGGFRKNQSVKFHYRGREFDPGIARGNCWKHTAVRPEVGYSGMERMAFAGRLYVGKSQLRFVRYKSDFGIRSPTGGTVLVERLILLIWCKRLKDRRDAFLWRLIQEIWSLIRRVAPARQHW